MLDLESLFSLSNGKLNSCLERGVVKDEFKPIENYPFYS